MAKAVILGAGSIGCFAGLSWLNAGLDVTFVGRASIGEALRKSGATISGEDFNISIAADKIRFETTPDILSGADIILLCVKTTDDETAAQDIRHHARPGTIVLSLQNGVENAARLSTLLPDFEIVEGMVAYNVIRPSATHFKKATAGEIMAGHNAKLEAFAIPLARSLFAISFREDMRAVKWSKLLLNLNNALNALSGLTLYDELSQRVWRRLLAASMRECLTVLKAENITPAKLGPLPPDFIPAFLETPDWLFNRTGLKLQKIDRQSRSSMTDDFDAGRKTEIDFLNGAVLHHASRHAILCPVNEAITRLVKDTENGGKKIWRADEIMSAINRRSASAAS